MVQRYSRAKQNMGYSEEDSKRQVVRRLKGDNLQKDKPRLPNFGPRRHGYVDGSNSTLTLIANTTAIVFGADVTS